jgi:cell division septation protein DedD
LAAHAHDDGFHEIQLNGKQLVFLFMAATVVSVVIFLSGVLVGRGVRVDRSAGETADLSETTADLRPAGPPLPATPPAVGSDPTAAAQPPQAADDLRYFDRLEGQSQPAERLKASPASSAADTAAATVEPAPLPPAPREATAVKPGTPAARAGSPAAAATSGSGAASPPRASGFAVQVAALNSRSEADAMAKRLSSKGYSAFVMAPAGGTPTVYRVRVGPFQTRREADLMAARLEKEEQFKPWVAR